MQSHLQPTFIRAMRLKDRTRIRCGLGQLRALQGLLFVALLVSGCGSTNEVEQIKPDHWTGVRPGHAVVVYGMADEGKWPALLFAVTLNRYSIEQEQIIGNCDRFDYTEAGIKPGTATIQYFVFDVPPGNYVFGANNFGVLESPDYFTVYEVPSGSVTYIGDFVHESNVTYLGISPVIKLRRDLEAARRALGAYGALQAELTTARTLQARQIYSPRPCA